jgi:hypothetical protein
MEQLPSMADVHEDVQLLCLIAEGYIHEYSINIP